MYTVVKRCSESDGRSSWSVWRHYNTNAYGTVAVNSYGKEHAPLFASRTGAKAWLEAHVPHYLKDQCKVAKLHKGYTDAR